MRHTLNTYFQQSTRAMTQWVCLSWGKGGSPCRCVTWGAPGRAASQVQGLSPPPSPHLCPGEAPYLQPGLQAHREAKWASGWGRQIRKEKDCGPNLCSACESSHFSQNFQVMDCTFPLSRCYREKGQWWMVLLACNLTLLYGFFSFQVLQFTLSPQEPQMEVSFCSRFVMLPSAWPQENHRQTLIWVISKVLFWFDLVIQAQDCLEKRKKEFCITK